MRHTVAARKQECGDPAEIADALAYALRYDGNRRIHHADEVMYPARRGANDGQHAIIARLITEVFKYANQALAAPNHEPAPARPAPRFCNGLLIRVALNLGRANNFTFVVEKKEAAKLHGHSPVLKPQTIQIST